MIFSCAICGMEINFHLTKHIKSEHNISLEEYVENFTTGPEYCRLCGKKTKWSNRYKKFKEFCNHSCRATFFNTIQYEWRKDKLAEGIAEKWKDEDYRKKMSEKAKSDILHAQLGWKDKFENDAEFRRAHYNKLLKITKERESASLYQRIYYYNGYVLKSSYELKFAKWLDEHMFVWEYEPRSFVFNKGGVYGYIPDFWLCYLELFVEVKSTYWISDTTQKKIEFLLEYGYETILIHEENWEDILSYLLSTAKS